MKISHNFIFLPALLLVLGVGGCKKSYLDRMPSDQAPLSDVFKTTTSARAALQGLHRSMYTVPSGRQDDQFGQKSIDLYNDLMGDDMPLTDRGAGWFSSIYNYTASRTPSAPGTYPWNFYFGLINNANQIITNIDEAVGPQEEKDDIKGQAYFYRAYAYYNLSLYYQHAYGVPEVPEAPGLPIYTEPTREGKGRATMRQTYAFIKNDLASALALLSPLGGMRNDKSEINIDVVNGLAARVAFAMHEWDKAITYAQDARQNYPFMSRSQMVDGFNDWNNPEWIWGSKLVEEQTSNVASFIGQMDIASGGYAALGQQKHINRNLFNEIPDTDIRKSWWYALAEGNYKRFSQKKFKVKTLGSFATDVSYMRSAEMVLIEVEALYHKGNMTDAADLLQDFVRTRQEDYDVSPYTSSGEEFLLQVLWQRRVELWGEGFRFSDIKRIAPFGDIDENRKGLHREGTGASTQLMGSAITITEPLDSRFLFRIPGAEMQTNPLMQQNP